MQSYEALILIEPDVEEERQTRSSPAFVRSSSVEAARGTQSIRGGARSFSYEIQKHTEAHHWMVQFSSEPTALAEVDRVLRITDGVLRHKTLRRSAAVA